MSWSIWGTSAAVVAVLCERSGEALTSNSHTWRECVLLLQNVFSYYRMCPLTTECVLLLQNVFSSLECVLLIQNVFSSLVPAQHGLLLKRQPLLLHACFNLLLENVFSYYRMFSLTTECVLLLQNVFSYYRM